MIFLFIEFFDLVGECDIGQKQATILLIVAIFVGVLVSGVGELLHLKIIFKVEIHSY